MGDLMNKYKLHSCGENWFHFRKDLKSIYDSFSITYCHDGTVCMTGDMGCLAWIRHSPDGPDYGFPYEETGISYFAEKIVRAEEMQHIRTWKGDIARTDILEAMKAYRGMGCTNEITVFKEILVILDMLEDGEHGTHGQYEMINAFMERTHDIEGEDYCSYGECYMDAFVRNFEMLRSVSNIVLEAVKTLPDRQFNIHGYELLNAVGKPRGNSGMVHIPHKWIKEKVAIIRTSRRNSDD